MNQMPMIDDAIQLAVTLLRGSMDEAGEPVLLRALRVMLATAEQDEQICALLHFVVSRNDIPVRALTSLGYSSKVTVAVSAMTRGGAESCEGHIRRVANGPLLAKKVMTLILRDEIRGEKPHGDPKENPRFCAVHHAIAAIADSLETGTL